ncbi:succinylglutamate desuccinylase/aspartoacylase family protein [Luteolibacter sp. GHJ8]|uniref:Succinylglutamate desuccinylase/aspartoacylase family protein n=1 Tax=Luteolibacter rhizosphaerae TaxID=2989719 RepID=A0ABT3G186_9BACT|nr:succinylglutamate desuccinylase/aspartoacylase family protein [Luteolibacter rhizosphaerae]MCW1913276.1 succinylglutamate desuccinylase/aspartoacylase family protein [Luteolibacter rhizosphaerae]
MAEAFDVASFLKEFGELAESRGFIRRHLCDTDAGPLLAWERLDGTAPDYISAGMHGDEPAGPLAALELLRSGVLDTGAWAICPALNPTGLALGTRENGAGIDLNRDYLALSTEEVRTHTAWLASFPCPRFFASLHEDWETSGFYFYEINLLEDRPERAAAILQAVTPWFEPEPATLIDDHEIRSTGWIYHVPEADAPENWPEAIFLAKRGCPVSFTFETPSANCLNDRVAAHVAAVKAALASLAPL